MKKCLYVVLLWSFTVFADSPLLDFAASARGTGNQVLLLEDAYDALLYRVHLIRHANTSIDIQTFILADDECAQLIVSELVAAAKRGVRVRLLADHFMSSHEVEWIAEMATADPNFELRYYRPPSKRIDPSTPRYLLTSILGFRSANQRMHNKTMIVDDLIAMTGGRNIDNHYFNYSTSYNFLDRDIALVGPMVSDFCDMFKEYWDFRHSFPALELRDVEKCVRKNDIQFSVKQDDPFGYFASVRQDADSEACIESRFVASFMRPAKIRFLTDEPGKNHSIGLWGGSVVTHELRKMMKRTEEELIIQSPYLILARRGRKSFRKLHKKRPEARTIVLTNSFESTDNIVAYSANYKLRWPYIEKMGFEIHELKAHPDDFQDVLPHYADLQAQNEEEDERPFLSIHAKSMVRDGIEAFVGSYNLDPRSANLNSEMGLLIEDREFADKVRSLILGRANPSSSWVIAKKPGGLREVNALVLDVSNMSPIDLWPLRNTTSYTLKPGKEAVSINHPDFYENYEDAGRFPGDHGLSPKQISTSIYKTINKLALPVM